MEAGSEGDEKKKAMAAFEECVKGARSVLTHGEIVDALRRHGLAVDLGVDPGAAEPFSLPREMQLDRYAENLVNAAERLHGVGVTVTERTSAEKRLERSSRPTLGLKKSRPVDTHICFTMPGGEEWRPPTNPEVMKKGSNALNYVMRLVWIDLDIDNSLLDSAYPDTPENQAVRQASGLRQKGKMPTYVTRADVVEEHDVLLNHGLVKRRRTVHYVDAEETFCSLVKTSVIIMTLTGRGDFTRCFSSLKTYGKDAACTSFARKILDSLELLPDGHNRTFRINRIKAYSHLYRKIVDTMQRLYNHEKMTRSQALLALGGLPTSLLVLSTLESLEHKGDDRTDDETYMMCYLAYAFWIGSRTACISNLRMPREEGVNDAETNEHGGFIVKLKDGSWKYTNSMRKTGFGIKIITIPVWLQRITNAYILARQRILKSHRQPDHDGLFVSSTGLPAAGCLRGNSAGVLAPKNDLEYVHRLLGKHYPNEFKHVKSFTALRYEPTLCVLLRLSA